MSDQDDRIRDLVTRTFGLGRDAITREAMDQGWAPVERWHLRTDRQDVPQTVVIKTRRTGGSGWGFDPLNLTVEQRSLHLLAPTGLVPYVYASDDEIGVIVMEDIVGASTVERVLFGHDPVAANESLTRLAAAVGAMHTATAGAFFDPIPWHQNSILMTPLPDAWSTVTQVAHQLGLPDLGMAAAEIEKLTSLFTDPAWLALTNADANPSNVLVTDDRTILIDFEGANPRHVAMDGAGFALGFPTYRYWADLSPSMTTAMTDAWRAAIAPGFPAVADDAVFFSILGTGSLAHVIWRLTRLPLIADDRQPPDATRRRRTQIVRLIALAVEISRTSDAYPAITDRLDSVRSNLLRRWPDAAAPRRYPAFNGGSREGWTIRHDI